MSNNPLTAHLDEREDHDNLNASVPSSPLPKYEESTVPAYSNDEDISINIAECDVVIDEIIHTLELLPFFEDVLVHEVKRGDENIDPSVETIRTLALLPFFEDGSYREVKGREEKADRSGRRDCGPRPGIRGNDEDNPNDRDKSDRGNDKDHGNTPDNSGNTEDDEDGGGDPPEANGASDGSEDGEDFENDSDDSDETEDEDQDDTSVRPVEDTNKDVGNSDGMESLLETFHFPFQRRLNTLYSGAKSSHDLFKSPLSERTDQDPALEPLYRKLRIQKDRLVSWGLQWSEPSASPNTDDSLSRVGHSDVVRSIMSTIKDILSEAEPLWHASKRSNETVVNTKEKDPIILWDQTRFEDLICDLTSSIDTLYGLSQFRKECVHCPSPIIKSASRDTYGISSLNLIPSLPEVDTEELTRELAQYLLVPLLPSAPRGNPSSSGFPSNRDKEKTLAAVEASLLRDLSLISSTLKPQSSSVAFHPPKSDDKKFRPKQPSLFTKVWGSPPPLIPWSSKPRVSDSSPTSYNSKIESPSSAGPLPSNCTPPVPLHASNAAAEPILTAIQLSYIHQSLVKAGLTDDVLGVMSSIKATMRKANAIR